MFQKQRISLLTQKFTSPLMACAISVLHLVHILSQSLRFEQSRGMDYRDYAALNRMELMLHYLTLFPVIREQY